MPYSCLPYSYIDTQIAVWLCGNMVQKLTPRAVDAINEYDLLISPMVLVELNFLQQIGKIIRAPLDLAKQLRMQVGARICDHSFPDIADTALFETWTHDPFDLMIVAHAKSNGYAPLITSDEKIRAHYPQAIW